MFPSQDPFMHYTKMFSSLEQILYKNSLRFSPLLVSSVGDIPLTQLLYRGAMYVPLPLFSYILFLFKECKVWP